MGKANNRKVQDFRENYGVEPVTPFPNQKEAPRIVGKLQPLNPKQKEYISAINVYDMVVCCGVWGSSKTYIPSVMAADMLNDKSSSIDKIIIARPTEGKGKSIGFLSGDKNQKLEPWCEPVISTLKGRLGNGAYSYYLGNGQIEMLALEHVKGRSWNDCFIIIDEAEDLDEEVAESLMGRIGDRSKMVITGDFKQQDLKKVSGLQFIIDMVKFYDDETEVPVIDFDSWDYCVRSERAKKNGMAIEKLKQHRAKSKK